MDHALTTPFDVSHMSVVTILRKLEISTNKKNIYSRQCTLFTQFTDIKFN